MKQAFAPKVILLNHEKRLGTDTACANLSIKYNLIYVSAYQLIRSHIESESEWGQKLLATKRKRKLEVAMQMRDEFQEAEFSPALFNQSLVF